MTVPHGIDRSGVAGGTGAQGLVGSLSDLTDPGADRILFWDDSAGDLDWLSLGTGLTITGTSMALHANLVTMLGLAVTDGNFIVGDGSTWVVESGATARASLGVVDASNPTAAGEFIIGETASNAVSVPFAMGGSPLINGTVSLSVAASVLTITVLGHDGAAISASNPVFVRIPQGNPLDGTYALRKTTAALSMTVSLGSTLGTANGATTPLYVYVLDNAGVPELAISATYYGQQSVRSTVTEGGAGGADSFTTIYSATGRTSVPIVPVLKWDCAQTSAGVWLSVTGEKQLAPGDRGWMTIGDGLLLSNAVLSAVVATQAEQEAGVSLTVATSPGRQHFHPSAAKCWVDFSVAGVVAASYNITSVTDSGAGDWTVNIATDMSSGDYCAGASENPSGGTYNLTIGVLTLAAGSFRILSIDTSTSAFRDPNSGPVFAWAFGDQA